jgi:RimJ/RimL family protein N-acetyltransferase
MRPGAADERDRARETGHVHHDVGVPESTPRLTLRRMATGDAQALWPMLSDARMWSHHPEGRHHVVAQSQAYVERAAERWSRDGLSYWTVELTDGGDVIGAGGVQVHPRGHWNLNYRIAVPHQGQGYATELAAAALAAAQVVGPGRPCIAWIDEDNTASRAVATRIGLTDMGLRGGSADDVPRLAYSDRPLDAQLYPVIR